MELEKFKNGTFIDYDRDLQAGTLFDEDDNEVLKFEIKENDYRNVHLFIGKEEYTIDEIKNSNASSQNKQDLIFEIEKLDEEIEEMKEHLMTPDDDEKYHSSKEY